MSDDFPSQVAADVLSLVEDMISNRENVVEVLNVEIERVQMRYTVLSAIRDSLLPEVEEVTTSEELPLATPTARSVASDGWDLESLITQHVSQHGPSKPSDIAKAIGVHHTSIGRAVNASNSLAKDGKMVIVKLS